MTGLNADPKSTLDVMEACLANNSPAARSRAQFRNVMESPYSAAFLRPPGVTKSTGAPKDARLAATQRRDVSRFRVCRGLLSGEMRRTLATLRIADELHDDRIVAAIDLPHVDREQTCGILGNLDLNAIHPEQSVRLADILHGGALQDLDVATTVDPTGEHLKPPRSETVTRTAYALAVTKSRSFA